jgi:hypothetical protein
MRTFSTNVLLQGPVVDDPPSENPEQGDRRVDERDSASQGEFRKEEIKEG